MLSRVLGLLAALSGLLGLWAVAFAPGAGAVFPCPTGAVTFSSTGAEQCYTVPAGVDELSVTAVGAMGASGSTASSPGGYGAVVSGEIPVRAGETLYVEVGGNGTANTGGFNGGGGINGATAGGGGGASDVRTCSTTAASCPGGAGTSLDSRLLIAAGGGGGGFSSPGGAGGSAGIDPTGQGAMGTAGNNSGDQGGGGGGAGATQSGGGVGGTGGAGTYDAGSNGGDGGLGTGGTGGSSYEPYAAGGGGGGLYGGGGGGGWGTDEPIPSGAGGGGGGAGSSWVAPFATEDSIATDTTGVAKVVITPLVAALSASPAAGLSFASQPQATLSASKTVTVTDTGTGSLQISSLTFAGADPQDFVLSSDGCLGQIAAGSSCTLGVSFAPQAQGARSASLEIAGNDPNSPASVPLSGTGGQLPQGPAGQTGKQGPAGQIELVVCKTVTKTTKKHGHKHTTKVQKCSTRVVSGTVKFTTTGSISASLTRAHLVYATGTALATGQGRWHLMLKPKRTLRAGRYTLTLTTYGGRRVLVRTTIAIS